jgi:hypothetical protein
LDWPEILSSATVAILAVWLGATVISRAPTDSAARLFALLTLTLTAWAGSRALLGLADVGAEPLLRQVNGASAYLLPVIFAHLVATFTTTDGGRRRWALIVLGWAISIPIAVRAFVDADRPFHVDAPHFSLPGLVDGEVFGWAWIGIRLTLLAAAAWWAWLYLSDVRGDRARRAQAQAVLITVALATVGGGLLILPTLSRPPLWFSTAVLAAALGCATYAVIAQRVFLAPEIARRALSSTLARGAAVMGLIAIVSAVEVLADRALGVGLPIVTALTLALTLAIYDPARASWRRVTRAQRALNPGVGIDELAVQEADESIRPALARLVWRFDLAGARATATDGRMIAELGTVEKPAATVDAALGSETHARLFVGPKRSGLPFSDAERRVLEQTADYLAVAIDLGERQRQHADEQESLLERRDAQESKARALAAAVDARTPPVLRVFALGPLRAQLGDEPIVRWGGNKAGSRQAEAVFAFLFDRGERGVAKDEFLDLIWPDVAFERSDGAFHRTMNGLRGVLQPAGATITFFNDRYHLQAGVLAWSDVGEFEAAVAEARSASTPGEAVRSLLDAQLLYRGDYLDDCPYYGDSAEVEDRRSRLRERYVDLLVALGTLYEEAGERPSAADAYRQALTTSREGCPPAADGLARLRANA